MNRDELPKCDYRVETTDAKLFICRHGSVRAINDIVIAGVCRNCRQREEVSVSPRPMPAVVPVPLAKRWRGVGDVVASVIKITTGISDCGGCEGRQHALNQLMPFGNELPPE